MREREGRNFSSAIKKEKGKNHRSEKAQSRGATTSGIAVVEIRDSIKGYLHRTKRW